MSTEEAIKREVGETAGYVSLCWVPKPTGVFDSEAAARAVEESVARLYADHVTALAEAEQRVRDEERSHFQEAVWTFDRGHTQGRAEALRQAREAVEDRRVPWPTATGDLVNEGIDEAIAAIDALAAGQAPAALTAVFLDEQAAWSINTFGPGDRLDGVLDHMAKEIEEARAKPDDVSEWADLAILAFDGAQRQGFTGQQFIDAWQAKFAKNRSRTWPDWRTAEPGKAIEHDRSGEAPKPKPVMTFDTRCAVCGDIVGDYGPGIGWRHVMSQFPQMPHDVVLVSGEAPAAEEEA